MKRVISGAKPTGSLTLGNYLGTMRSWAKYQDSYEAFYFVVDLHALNIRPNPEELRRQTWEMVAWLMAFGIDPRKSTIFVESHIPAISELQTILNNFVTMGELGRMTQFKDKSRKLGSEGQVAGLFQYPVLMTADILLFDIDVVPVGEDQIQHVELSRDIATRFNNLYGAETFRVPAYQVSEVAARVMNLQDPARKMSKSDDDKAGAIEMLDPARVIEAKVMRAVTDSGSRVEYSDDKPAVANLLEIYSAVSGMTIPEVVGKFSGSGYGDFKKDLAACVVDELVPVQRRYQELMADQGYLAEVMKRGSDRANELAEAKIKAVREKVGLI